jgi:Cu-Zn family superoxide dismutase
MTVIESHNKDHKIEGILYFEELVDGNTKIYGNIKGLPEGLHGFHIHESGDLTKGCKSLRGHYNPYNKEHGGRLINGKINYNRHIGDLGNIKSLGCDTVTEINIVDPLIKLRGNTNILGRSIIIHEGEDDLGLGGHELSKTTGNSGNRIACGLIVWS